ncbi:EamA/RhaT family transporter [Streptomyces sp. A012304]|uniref:EamA/RhaT family transporter n=1 Tax=Streptomyces sp. A012304 TaxID=375446 RepID=UPI0022307529|nr:EamA/RhaT family transporter [Streptomyces sp. A012304]GKQ37239.1 membrane protein [Streptomyces sp. A012304]
MSDENGTSDTSAGSPGSGTPTGPRPEPLRFFGTTWVDHDGGYPARRIAVAVGSLAAAAVSCLVLRFAYQGLAIADIGGFVTVLVVVMFAICSALAFRHTWDSFSRRPDPDRQASLRGLLAIGFVGSLLAYFFRSLTEAPGEKLHRQEYDEARTRHERRTTRRTGNPAKKRHRT